MISKDQDHKYAELIPNRNEYQALDLKFGEQKLCHRVFAFKGRYKKSFDYNDLA